MNPNGCLARSLRALVTVCGLGLGPSVLSAQKALVYCPVGIDPTGCTTLVQALGDSGGPFPQRVDMGYDGTAGTIDLTSADLSPYAVFIVPALADNADAKPYDLLRTATVANRLRNVLLGRIAVWSGTPDQGSLSRAQKNTLVRNLAAWGAANYATSGLRGLVVLQDYSDSVAQRYAWVAAISRLGVTADSAPGIYSEVQALTATATGLLNNGGQQLAYANMASFGIEPPGDSSGATADARGGTSGGQVVLVSSLGSGNGAATVKTDRADYAPGQVVTITGSGWQVGEVVSLVLHEDPPIDTHPTLTATADASGHVFNNTFAPDAHDVDVRFYLTATGQASGSVAQATFTDDNFAVRSIAPATGPTLGGTPVTITGTSFTSGRQPFTVAFGTGAPVSATRVDNQTLTATTPAHTAGIVDVIVTGNANQGNAASVTLTNGFTFTRVNPTVSFTLAPVSAVYQSSFTVASSTNSSASPVYTSSGACSNVGPTYTMTSGTATCTATVTWSADANYNGAQATQTTAAVKKAASVTPAPASKVYGSVDPALSGALSGFLVADGVSASYSRAAGETVGSYTISAALSPAGVLSNYDITYNTAAFAITKKAASVTPAAASKVYGSADPALSGALSGFLVADGVTASYSRAAGETVGSYTISAALSPAGVLSNYDVTYNTAAFAITKKAASVTPAAASKVYGSADPALSGALSGFLVADGVSASYSRAAGETVGSYTISAALSPAGVLSNYDITYNTAAFAITKKAASVTPDAKTRVYGSADPTLSGALSGFLVADGVTTSYSRAAGETVGSYPISATLAPAGVLGNYDITYNTASFDITKKTASVTPAAGQHKTYGDADPALSGSTSGFLAADGVTASYNRTAGETVGSYPISATLAPAGVLSNYDITYNTAAFAITKKAASVTPAAASKVYGSADPTLSGALSGFLVADGVSASYSRTAGETVGSYPISATLAPAGVLGNYDITYNTASFDITKKAASVTPDAKTKVYGSADPTLSGALSGFLVADGVTASYSRAAGETVGSYTISAALSPAGVLSNYDITYNTASFDITKKAASVTPDAKTKVYGSVDPALSGALSGFLGADGVTASYSRAAGETVGSYPISATLAPAGVLSNYDITYNTAAFAITKKAASVTPAAASKVYGSADPTLSGALSGFLVADGVSASRS